MGWMPEARQVAAQCWRDPETSDRAMDPALAEAFARRIAMWMECAAMVHSNTRFYVGLLDQCAEAIGEPAYTADDGSVMDSPLRLKLPGLVAELVAKVG